MIYEIEEKSILPVCLNMIHKSFATVADEFHLTKETCPGYTAFMALDKLQKSFESSNRMFLYYSDSIPVGFFLLKQLDGETWELDHLAVLPEYRHRGIGKELLNYAEKTVREQNGKLLKIGIMEENVRLKQWYLKNGFASTGTRRFEHLPFAVGFMEKDVEK
ncbi:MAG: GNAT family N-acetyltransferase [Clostridia bacterium]|nr:GNAT family N-acetyltransferase [Clostridia bacterium]